MSSRNSRVTRRRPPEKAPLARRAGAWLAWWVLLMSFWVILDDSIATDELLAGAGAAALAALLAELVTHQAAARVRIRARWLARAIELPGQVAGDTVIVFAALWRRLAHGEEPPSGFRVAAGPLRRRHGRGTNPPGAADRRQVHRPELHRGRHRQRHGHDGDPPAGGERRGGGVNSFVIAAIVMLLAAIPCGIVVVRGTTMDAVVAYEAVSSIVFMVLVLLAEGFRRSGEFELPVHLAVLLFGSGLVFVRFLERWL